MTESPNPALELYDLADRLGVAVCRACDRAKIARSTPIRWRNGTAPRPHLVTRLRAAIEAIAAEAGTAIDPSTASVVGREAMRQHIADIRRSADRLEAALDNDKLP